MLVYFFTLIWLFISFPLTVNANQQNDLELCLSQMCGQTPETARIFQESSNSIPYNSLELETAINNLLKAEQEYFFKQVEIIKTPPTSKDASALSTSAKIFVIAKLYGWVIEQFLVNEKIAESFNMSPFDDIENESDTISDALKPYIIYLMGGLSTWRTKYHPDLADNELLRTIKESKKEKIVKISPLLKDDLVQKELSTTITDSENIEEELIALMDLNLLAAFASNSNLMSWAKGLDLRELFQKVMHKSEAYKGFEMKIDNRTKYFSRYSNEVKSDLLKYFDALASKLLSESELENFSKNIITSWKSQILSAINPQIFPDKEPELEKSIVAQEILLPDPIESQIPLAIKKLELMTARLRHAIQSPLIEFLSYHLIFRLSSSSVDEGHKLIYYETHKIVSGYSLELTDARIKNGPIKLSVHTFTKNGFGIFAHEMGHGIFEFAMEGKLSSKRNQTRFKELADCLDRTLHPNSGEEKEQNAYYNGQISLNRYTNEDFSDLVSALSVGSKGRNMGCYLIPFPIDEPFVEGFSLQNLDTSDPHSSFFTRALHVDAVKNGTLNHSCSQYLRRYEKNYVIASCLP